MPQKNCYYLYFYCLFPGQNPTNTFKNRFWGWSCSETKSSSLHHRHLSSKESARIYRKFNVLVAPVIKQYWYKTSLMLVGGNNWTSQLLRLEEKLSHCRYKQDLNKERESENIQKRFRYCPTLNHNQHVFSLSSTSAPTSLFLCFLAVFRIMLRQWEETRAIAGQMLDSGDHSLLVDFDSHLDDITKDWTNQKLNNKIAELASPANGSM